MGMFDCFCSSLKKNKDKGEGSSAMPEDRNKNNTLHIKVEHVLNGPEVNESKTTSFSVPVPFSMRESSNCEVKVMNHSNTDAGEVDYEGEDEHDETLSMKRENSGFDLHVCVENSNKENWGTNEICHSLVDGNSCDEFEGAIETIKTGHVSDPGIGKEEFCTSPILKRSCSDLVMRSIRPRELMSRTEEVKRLPESYQAEAFSGYHTSPNSIMTHRSADKVMLKKHSSSQILPSGSRRLWWKLFLWSHRNLHRAKPVRPHLVTAKPALNQQGGYCSDTIESGPAMESSKMGSPASFSEELVSPGNLNAFYGISGMWPQNQWVALPTESPLTRVDEWVKETSIRSSFQTVDNDPTENCIVFPPSPENTTSLARGSGRYHALNVPEEILHANSVVQSLNASSTVAHITGIGLKVIPSISHFSSLRSVNLSGNFIVHIGPGSLPKGLHILNLSRNRIHTIEGLRELTRLRVLDLSYNRISRIGQGLANCILIKELYLNGNKISTVEGLHRLWKLTVVDLSFNKITTEKALGQLVANYNSLKVLNLLGNPIQSNVSDEQLRKMLCSLLPKLAFLNKQPTKAREVGGDAIAKAAVGGIGSSRSARKKYVRSSGGAVQKNRQRSRTHSRLQSAGK